MSHVGFVMGHIRKLCHHLRVLLELILRSDHKLMQYLAVIVHRKPNGLAELNHNAIGREAHIVSH